MPQKIEWKRNFNSIMLAPPQRIDPQMCIDEKNQVFKSI